MIRSVSVVLFALAYILVVGAPYLLYTILTGQTDPIYRAGVLGARLTVRLAGVRLEVIGQERIPEGRAVVFMMNHQSNCDPPAVIGLLPPVLILGKAEFFRTPILGRAMRMRGFIPVDRSRRERAILALEQATDALKAGHSFLVFPEGTRSPHGRLLPFKKGVFIMAIKAAAPVVPISISRSRKIMPKGRFVIRPGVVRITFHDPVETAGCSVENLHAIQHRVREAILAGLAAEEWPLDEVA
ncbi:MAG TPA: lysophospholipid acyltransferase family protein [Terriglobia bacterium]|nr:lysophospholipid acyltransferase family protein [Terriglobia bacterium]